MTTSTLLPSVSNYFSRLSVGSSPSWNYNYINNLVLLDNNCEYTQSSRGEDFFSISHYKSDNEKVYESDYDILCKKLASFEFLEEDWDGYDGVPASGALVDFAMNVLSELDFYSIPSVMLSGAGNISFYWKTAFNKSYVEIELDSVGNYNYLVKNPDEVYGEEDVDFYEIGLSRGLVSGLTDHLKYSNQKNVA